jgi:hypothetical protein
MQKPKNRGLENMGLVPRSATAFKDEDKRTVLRASAKNKSTGLRRILVDLRGAAAGSYRDMCRLLQQSRWAKRQVRWWIYF